MALDKKISTAPGTRPDPKYATDYKGSRGGHFKTEERPVPGTPKTEG